MFYDTVSDLLERRPPGRPVAVDGDVTVANAAREIAERAVGALLVTRGHYLEGVLTPRDIVLNLEARGLDPSATAVRQLLSPAPTVLGCDRAIDVVRLMLESGLHYVPVTDGRAVLTLLSIDELTGWLTDELRVQVEQALRIVNTHPAGSDAR